MFTTRRRTGHAIFYLAGVVCLQLIGVALIRQQGDVLAADGPKRAMFLRATEQGAPAKRSHGRFEQSRAGAPAVNRDLSDVDKSVAATIDGCNLAAVRLPVVLPRNAYWEERSLKKVANLSGDINTTVRIPGKGDCCKSQSGAEEPPRGGERLQRHLYLKPASTIKTSLRQFSCNGVLAER